MMSSFVCACRSDRDNSWCVCRSRRPPAHRRGDCRADVLQERQRGQLHLQEVALPPCVQPRVFRSQAALNGVHLRRKVHSAPDRLNPMFQEPNVKDRPEISQPTFMDSTAAQACAPLLATPSRPPPQVPTASRSANRLSAELYQ